MRRSGAATGVRWGRGNARAPRPDPLTEIRDREKGKRWERGDRTSTADSDDAWVDGGVGLSTRGVGTPGPDGAPSSLEPP